MNTVVLEKIRRWILDCASDALEVCGEEIVQKSFEFLFFHF